MSAAMELYPLLRLAHVVGIILLGGGLLAVFVSELRAYRSDDPLRFAEAAWYTATYYDALVLPGALLLGVSGLAIALELGLDLLRTPWLAGMWGLFAFEFVEGNTVTRIAFRRALRRSRQALAEGRVTDATRREARGLAGRIAHFLDLPLFAAIVVCGALRPDDWGHVGAAVVAAVAVAAALAVIVPRLARPPAPA